MSRKYLLDCSASGAIWDDDVQITLSGDHGFSFLSIWMTTRLTKKQQHYQTGKHTLALLIASIVGTSGQQQSGQIADAKKRKRADTLKKVKELWKEFGFTAVMLKSALAEGRKPKS